eukprot:2164965-Rhodomonas_salina.2
MPGVPPSSPILPPSLPLFLPSPHLSRALPLSTPVRSSLPGVEARAGARADRAWQVLAHRAGAHRGRRHVGPPRPLRLPPLAALRLRLRAGMGHRLRLQVGP